MASMVPWKVLLVIVLLIFCLSMAKISNAAGGPQGPVGLRCEYLANPIGVDVRQPRFFWVLEHSERGQKQTAYQILVSTQPACEKGDMWDSGKVSSVESAQIIYKGKPLASDKSYFWRVRYWDKDGNPGPYSEIATFDTGLFSKEDWEGTWIGGANQLRKEFRVNGRVVRARAFICGLGYSELRLNGRKVGANVLDPGWTTYDKRALYVGYDVTNMIQQGANAAGVILGKGWYKSIALLFQLNIQLVDGQTICVVSDSLWKSKNGPIVEDSLYNGEIYDARLEMPGWDRPGYDDKSWKPAEGIQGPKGVLSAQMMPPIRIVDTIVPLKMSNPKPSVYVFDMGQNFSGWARLRVSGPAGAVVKMRFAEMLYDDGMLNQENLRAARAEDTYILKGEGEETYEPRFTYHGFRYVELTGFPGVPNAETIRGRIVHSSVKQAGSFACSKPVLNSLQRVITWGQKTNLHSIPTDCNQRDERMGWMGDAQGTAEEAIMNFDMAAFYTNFIRDMRDAQNDIGVIPDTVPKVWGGEFGDPAWGSAYPLLCWYMFQYYGDTRILEEQYEGLKKYVEFMRSKTENGLLKYSYYGDWVAVEKTPGSIVSSFYYYYDVKILGDTAKILGIEKDAQAYAKLAEGIKAAFHTEYFDPKTKNYANGTQTANTLALFLELAPKNERGAAWGNLFDNLVYKNNSHLTTGIIGTKYIMELLTRFDNSDLAYDVATQTTYPSWGYMIENGATTLWELWQLRQGSSMNSHNHPMFGSVGAWLYKALAGINLDPTAVAFKKVRIEPQMVRDLFYASGSIDTLRGRVLSSWKRSEKSVCIDVTVPVGSEAEVILPKFNLKSVVVKDSGKTLWAQKKLEPGIPGILNVTESAQAVILKIGSGRYSFELSGE
jgi:alpha-L-rhamnosidase